MFSIATTAIDADALKAQLNNDQAGALTTFEGWVRNHNDGQAVNSLEYEAHLELAEKEGLKIIEEATEKFDLLQAVCVHRIGHLAIGDMAVWVGVSSAHRDAAFQACRFIIDEVKQRVPIWKKEHYSEGPSEWLEGETKQ